jgi:hypothetical protein
MNDLQAETERCPSPARASRALLLRLTPAEYEQIELWSREAGIAQLSRFVKQHLFVGNTPITPNGLNRRPIVRLTLAMGEVHQDCLVLLAQLDRRVAGDKTNDLDELRALLLRVLDAYQSVLDELASTTDYAAYIHQHTAELPRIAAMLDAIAAHLEVPHLPRQRHGT